MARAGIVIEQGHVEAAASDVYTGIQRKERSPWRCPRHVVNVHAGDDGDAVVVGDVYVVQPDDNCYRRVVDDLGDAVAQEEPWGALGAVDDAGQVEVGVAEAAGADAKRVGQAQIAARLWATGEHGRGRNSKTALLNPAASTGRYYGGAPYWWCCLRP